MRRIIEKHGAQVLRSTQAELEIIGSEIGGVRTDNNEEVLKADAYLVSGGSWTPEICRKTGYKPLILPARGLGMLFDTSGEEIISTPALFEDDGLGVAQHNKTLLRITSFFEMVGFNDKYSEKRKKFVLDIARRHLSRFNDLKTFASRCWIQALHSGSVTNHRKGFQVQQLVYCLGSLSTGSDLGSGDRENGCRDNLRKE